VFFIFAVKALSRLDLLNLFSFENRKLSAYAIQIGINNNEHIIILLLLLLLLCCYYYDCILLNIRQHKNIKYEQIESTSNFFHGNIYIYIHIYVCMYMYIYILYIIGKRYLYIHVLKLTSKLFELFVT